MENQPLSDWQGKMVGRYQMIRLIGRGGMSEVWLAMDTQLRRQVALKILPPVLASEETYLRDFAYEARAAASLEHPHILGVHDFGEQQVGQGEVVPYLVMPYMPGGTLRERMAAAHGPLPVQESLRYLRQAAQAIDYAHSRGIIHRDIKPANMLLREDNWLLLTDFGIAKILTSSDSSAKTGASLGTPTYMAPEQAQGQAMPASDIYSLAIVTYQLFTGRVPFHADNPYALTFQHAFASAPAPHIYNPALPPEFEAALLRGMAKDPTQRPLTATAFVTNLQQGLQFQRRPTQPVGSARPVPMPQSAPAQPAPRSTRRNVLVGLGVGALLVGGGAAAYALSPLAHHGPTTLKPTPTALRPTASATSATNAPLAITAAFNKPVTQMVWSPVNNVLLTVSQDATDLDNGLGKLWSMPVAGQSTAPTQLASHNFNSAGNGLLPAWSPDGTKVALANAGVNASLGAEVLFYTGDFSGPVSSLPEKTVSLSNQGNFCGLGWLSNTLLATLEAVVSANASKLALKTWNIQHSPSSPALVTINLGPGLGLLSLTPPNGLAISPNGSAIAVVLSNGVQVGKIQTSGKQSTWQALSPVLPFQGSVGVLGWSAD